MRLRRMILAVLALCVVSPAGLRAEPGDALLNRWAGPGFLWKSPSGERFVVLRAVASWKPTASRQPGAYQTQVMLPSGQILKRPLATNEGPGRSDSITFAIPAAAVQNLRPDQVHIVASVVDHQGVLASTDDLAAAIDRFPVVRSDQGLPPALKNWPSALPVAPGVAALLPNSGYAPEGVPGLRFARISPGATADAETARFLSITEVSMSQVNAVDCGVTYGPDDLKVGESRITLAAPAYSLTAQQAVAYLESLGKAEGLGLIYRLPTRSEWETAALAGRTTRFWWGDDPKSPKVHFRGNPPPGPKPVRPLPDEVVLLPQVVYSRMGYEPNPLGLWHTFGNLAEWAAPDEPGETGYWKLGGTFQTETEPFRKADLAVSVPSDDRLEGLDETDPPQWVGVRPICDLTRHQGEQILTARLGEEPGLQSVAVVYDPVTASASLEGEVATWDLVTRAEELLSRVDATHPPLWFLAAVVNELHPPLPPPGELAHLENSSEPPTLRFALDDRLYEVPVTVRWAPVLGVEGSSYWVNLFTGTGVPVFSYPLTTDQVGVTEGGRVAISQRAVRLLGLGLDEPLLATISLGPGPALSLDDPRIVSNRLLLEWDASQAPLPDSGQISAPPRRGRR